MTLIVATRTPTGVWMGSERIEDVQGADVLMAGPKIADLGGLLVGAAGTGRVMQTIEVADLPARDDGPLELWLTRWCHRVHDLLAERGLIREPSDQTNAPVMAGYSAMVVAADRRVFLVDWDLEWIEPARGWVALGSAASTFAGAYEVLREHHDPITAARYAWPFAQRHYHVGDLADELVLEAA